MVICEVETTPTLGTDAETTAAQGNASKPGPCGLVLPPQPCQRATGTSASNSMSADSFASSTVFGQVMSSRPSSSDITQPLSRLVWNVPSLSLRVLSAGLVSFRFFCLGLMPVLLLPPDRDDRRHDRQHADHQRE